MGFKTIDLDAPGGYDRYNKMKKTNSVKKAFEDEIEQKNEEALAPVLEKEPKQDTSLLPHEGKWVTGELPPKVEPKEDTIQDNIVRTGVVKGVSQLRVRTKPEGDILYLISEDSIVKILEDCESWWFVETAPGRQGYVMKQFIQVHTEGG